MTKRRIACVLLLAALTAAGCASRMAVPQKTYQGDYKSYVAVLNEWTRGEKLYHLFDTQLIVNATYHSAAYREALRLEQARAEQWLPDEITRRKQKDESEMLRSVRFLFSAYTPVASWNNFADKSPSFRLWLADVKGSRVGPEKITEIKLKNRSDLLYRPYVNEWAKNYEVLFPNRSEDGQPLVLTGGTVALVAAGIQGSVRLEWKIR